MLHVFIDGQAGTTGLEITDRLRARSDVRLITLSDVERKDPARRRDALKAANVAILCLPDEAAREAVQLAAGDTRIIDASTAHRTSDEWVYGLPELDAAHRERLRNARYVANPGCYPQGFILMVKPLIEAGLLPADHGLTCHALSGYSGGGRQMIEKYRAASPGQLEIYGARPYGLTFAHKHVPEMQHFSGTRVRPLFAPIVCNYYKGMLVHVPLFASRLGASAEAVRDLLAERYADEPFINVLETGAVDALDAGYLDPVACNGTNRMDIMVFASADQVLLTARYDNLGKGAAGAAVQNLNLMLGVDEQLGLTK
ncbi:MAG: N-acetyl-gamma-glutamyl-phosphate reductase [Pseudomonadales bacterium]